MTTATPGYDGGAQYDGLKELLPKLARPHWVFLIGPAHRPNSTLAALEEDTLDKREKKKRAKARYKAYKRLYDTVHGTA